MSRYPDHLSPNANLPKGLSKAQKSRARREPSGVFSLFQAPQIQQFKEAFQLIDHDKDGWVNEQDLREIFTSLGGSDGRRVNMWLTARFCGYRDLATEEDDRGTVKRPAGDA
jgi:myosin regulatory light chain 12